MAEDWEVWEEEHADELREIEVFERQGHTPHCACRLVWGDGECECSKRERSEQ